MKNWQRDVLMSVIRTQDETEVIRKVNIAKMLHEQGINEAFDEIGNYIDKLTKSYKDPELGRLNDIIGSLAAGIAEKLALNEYEPPALYKRIYDLIVNSLSIKENGITLKDSLFHLEEVGHDDDAIFFLSLKALLARRILTDEQFESITK